MNGQLDKQTEDKLSDFIVDMNLKYEKVFSVIDIDIEQFQKWENVLLFYKKVKKEGIVLWKQHDKSVSVSIWGGKSEKGCTDGIAIFGR